MGRKKAGRFFKEFIQVPQSFSVDLSRLFGLVV